MKIVMKMAYSLPVWSQWQIHVEYSIAHLALLPRKKNLYPAFSRGVIFSVHLSLTASSP